MIIPINTPYTSWCYISFHHHLPIWVSKVQIFWRTIAQMTFLYLLPKEIWELFFCTESRMSTLLACPIRATVISWSFKMLIWLLLAPDNRASAYVAPCTCSMRILISYIFSVEQENTSNLLLLSLSLFRYTVRPRKKETHKSSKFFWKL